MSIIRIIRLYECYACTLYSIISLEPCNCELESSVREVIVCSTCTAITVHIPVSATPSLPSCGINDVSDPTELDLTSVLKEGILEPVEGPGLASGLVGDNSLYEGGSRNK